MMKTPAAVILVFLFIAANISTSLAADMKAENFAYNSSDMRDPFIPLITQNTKVAAGLETVESIDDLMLEGIVWDAGGGSIAIMNGVIVENDQKIGSIKILRIEEKSVKLTINDIEYDINLKEEEE